MSALEHRWAMVTALGTFLLIMAGGTVNPTGSSLACPEAFVVCKGELFPEMTGGVLFEHGHRQIAMLVGLLQLGLSILLWLRRPTLRRLAVVALAMVALQALLGALTVYFKLPWFVSTAHLMLAMAYFATTFYQVWRTRETPRSERSPRGSEAGSNRMTPWASGGAPRRGSPAVRRWIAIGGAAVFAQILLGGLVRHHGAALASIDLPLHEGSLWVSGASLPLQLHLAHRMGGIIVGLVAITAAIGIARAAGDWPALRRTALAVPVAVLLQITLGALVILSFRTVYVTVLHFGGAALLWGLFAAMWLQSAGISPAGRRTAAEAEVHV